MTATLTCHGYERLKERVGAKGGQCSTYAQRAYEKGRKIESFGKELQKYLTNVLSYSSKAEELRVWGQDVYLFGFRFGGSPKLITSFPIPKKLWDKEIMRRNRYGR